jgi:SAM-dependent methyltransferase
VIRCLALGLSLWLLPAGATAVRFHDLSPALRAHLAGIRTPADFDCLLRKINDRTAARVEDGEKDALLYYALQARSFTSLPPIDPAAAAWQHFKSGEMPPEVKERFAAFSQACRRGASGDRQRYVCARSHDGDDLAADFPRAINFIYRKEFEARKREGDERRDFIASLYRSRGLSTDSSFDANFPVFLALRQLAGHPGIRLDKVLIIGPGLEFAARTALDDSIPPQSIQPYAVADALLQLGLSTRDRLQIHCLDINPRVVEYFRSQAPRRLTIVNRPGPDEYERYYTNFGTAVGVSTPENGRKKIMISPAVAAMVTAEQLNIVTERPAPSPRYDLVVATNVLVYLERDELALAVANIASQLRGGGYFIHNELRAGMESLGVATSMPVVDARMVRLLETEQRAIFDGQVTHRKNLKQ